MKHIIQFITVLSLFALSFSCSSTSSPERNSSTKSTAVVAKEAPKIINTYGLKTPGVYAVFNTNKGTIRVRLYYKRVPNTVANFIGLSEGTKESNKTAGVPFYNNTVFHRVIADFMVQGGDPEGT